MALFKKKPEPKTEPKQMEEPPKPPETEIVEPVVDQDTNQKEETKEVQILEVINAETLAAILENVQRTNQILTERLTELVEIAKK